MKNETSKPVCRFCGKSGNGVQFAMFNPRFKPFGTACVECEATLPEGTTVPEAKPETPKPGKWSACPANPPGPIQVNRFNKALNKLSHEHNTGRELWGVIGGEEHEMSFFSVFGGGRRDDVAKVQGEIGERYGWTVSKANINAIVAEMEAAMPALIAGRPVKDNRKT